MHQSSLLSYYHGSYKIFSSSLLQGPSCFLIKPRKDLVIYKGRLRLGYPKYISKSVSNPLVNVKVAPSWQFFDIVTENRERLSTLKMEKKVQYQLYLRLNKINGFSHYFSSIRKLFQDSFI